MARKSDRSAKLASKIAFNRLSNSMTLGMLSGEQIDSAFASFLRAADESTLKYDIRKLIAVRKIRERMPMFARRISDFSMRMPFRASESRLLDFHLELIKSESTALEEFYRLSNKFEEEFFNGQYESAITTLDLVERLSGPSLWVIRNRILVLTRQGEIDEVSSYCEKSKEEGTDTVFSLILKFDLLIASDPLAHYPTILSTIDELRDAGLIVFSDFLSLLFVPTPLIRSAAALNCLIFIHTYPLVDQITLLIPYLANAITVDGTDSALNKKRKKLLDFLINSFIRDSVVGSAELISKYETGSYVSNVDAENFDLTWPDTTVFFPLLAKSEREQTLCESSGSPAADLLSSMRSLFRMSGHPAQDIDLIKGWSIQSNHLIVAAKIQLLAYQCLPNQFSEKDRRIAAKKTLLTARVQSEWLNSLANTGDPVLTHKYIVDYTKLPLERKIKYEIRNCYADSSSKQLVLRLLDQFKAVVRLERDYNELFSSVMLNQGDMLALIGAAAQGLGNNPFAYTSYPMKVLLEYIEKHSLSTASAVVICFYAVKNLFHDKEYVLNEAFEEFLINQNVRRPSELSIEKIPKNLLDVLQRDIATIETLDFLCAFDSSNDVRAERIKILEILMRRGSVSPDQNKQEIDEILTGAVVEAGATAFTVNKIDVNDFALRRKTIDEFSALCVLCRSYAGSMDESYISLANEDVTDIGRAVATGDRTTTLLKMYSLALNSFLFDEKYGLDKCLSAEIRHGFFANLMRLRLDAHHVLTEVDEEGNYLSNKFWISANEFVADEILEAIDGDLKWFSAEYNKLIDEAENWMKVSTDPSEIDRIFSYPIYDLEVSDLGRIVDSSLEAEEILERCFADLWTKTDDKLSEIRERLDGVFRTSVDELLTNLLDKINDSRGTAAMTELIAAIRKCRNEIKEDISLVREWFKRAGAVSLEPQKLTELVAIANECYARIRRIDQQPDIVSIADLSDVRLEGRHMKNFVIAILNLYENCIKHSGFGLATPISVTINGDRHIWDIVISNPVTHETGMLLVSNKLRSARERIEKPRFAGLVRQEGGGTGLRKVKSLISSINDSYSLEIFATTERFDATVKYHE